VSKSGLTPGSPLKPACRQAGILEVTDLKDFRIGRGSKNFWGGRLDFEGERLDFWDFWDGFQIN